MATTTELLSDELLTDADRDELEAYRGGAGQLAFDNPPRGAVHEYSNPYDDGTYYRQQSYRGEPAWCCMLCLKVTLGADPRSCDGCDHGDGDDLAPLLGDPVECRAVKPYDGPCLIAESDGCHCPDGETVG